MRITHTRNVFNSLFNHLKNLAVSGSLTTGDGSVDFVDAYPLPQDLKRMVPLKDYDSSDDTLICLPVVSFETLNVRESGHQLGSLDKKRKTQVAMSVFAENELQAEYLADWLCSGILSHNVRLYDYNQNYSNPPDIGRIMLEDDYSIVFHYTEIANELFSNTIDLVFTVISYNDSYT